MKTVSEILRGLGALSPATAVTTDRVIKAVRSEPIPVGQRGKPVGPDRLVYTELTRDPNVRRVDVETDYASDANGWYAV